MFEIDSQKIDKNLLMDRIEGVVKDLDDLPSKLNSKRGGRAIYTIDDFTKYHDVEFLENLYKRVLLREIESEALEDKLNLLRSGRRTKTDIIVMVRYSREGRDKGVQISGIKSRFIFSTLSRIPILGLFVKLLMLPRFMERVNRFEANYFFNLNNQNSKIEHIQDSIRVLDSKMNTIQNSLNGKIYKIRDRVDNLEFSIVELRRFRGQLTEIENSLSNLVKSIESNDNNFKMLEEIKREQNHYLDDLYISFEDRFRGSREDIKERQSYYLPIVESVIKVKEQELIIDIGSGRGEWLELLRESGFRAEGVDLNRLMVQESKALNLDVMEQDGIEFLKSLDESSVSVITGFHIVEHLPFKVLIELFDESYRVLRDDGLIIFETPNPENILVGSCSFYTDPTHKNPIPPVTLEFLAQNRGFRDVKVHRLHPIKEPIFVDIPNSGDLNNLISASTNAQDYSIVGYK